MGPEAVAWGLLAVGAGAAVVLGGLVLGRLRRLRRARAAATSDVARRVARLRLLAATRENRGKRPHDAIRTP